MYAPTNFARESELEQIVRASPSFMEWLKAVRSLELESWCIGAGAVRNLVWDHLHNYKRPSPLSDVDVAYFEETSQGSARDHEIQALLCDLLPATPWEVTNQALVHTWFEGYFGHPVDPLHSLEDAVASWPEYATSVGVFLDNEGAIRVIAPHGLEDLFALRVQRNPTRVSIETYRQRVAQKQYTSRWPKVTVVKC